MNKSKRKPRCPRSGKRIYRNELEAGDAAVRADVVRGRDARRWFVYPCSSGSGLHLSLSEGRCK